MLLFLASPFLRIRLASSDVTVLPAHLEAHRGYERLKISFPDEAATHVNVAIEFPTEPAFTAERIGALHDVSAKIAALPNVTKVLSVAYGDSRLDRAGYQTMLIDPPGPYAPMIEAAKAASSKGWVVMIQRSPPRRPKAMRRAPSSTRFAPIAAWVMAPCWWEARARSTSTPPATCSTARRGRSASWWSRPSSCSRCCWARCCCRSRLC